MARSFRKKEAQCYHSPMRTFLKFLAVIGLIAITVVIYIFWSSFSSIAAAETGIDGRLNALITFYADLDGQYVTPLKSIPDLTADTQSSLDEIHTILVPLANPPSGFDARLAILMEAQQKIRQFVTSATLSPALTSTPSFVLLSQESSNLGKASVLVKEFNTAVGAYNGQLLSKTGNLIGQWSLRKPKQFLNIDGTFSDSTVVLFN